MALFRTFVVFVWLQQSFFAILESGNICFYVGAKRSGVKNEICWTMKSVCSSSSQGRWKSYLAILNSIHHFKMIFPLQCCLKSARHIFLAWNTMKCKIISIGWTYWLKGHPFVLILWFVKFSFFSSGFFSHHQYHILLCQKN